MIVYQAECIKRHGSEETELPCGRCPQTLEERKDLSVNTMVLASEMSSKVESML